MADLSFFGPVLGVSFLVSWFSGFPGFSGFPLLIGFVVSAFCFEFDLDIVDCLGTWGFIFAVGLV